MCDLSVENSFIGTRISITSKKEPSLNGVWEVSGVVSDKGIYNRFTDFEFNKQYQLEKVDKKIEVETIEYDNVALNFNLSPKITELLLQNILSNEVFVNGAIYRLVN